jgi:hypothetical protein
MDANWRGNNLAVVGCWSQRAMRLWLVPGSQLTTMDSPFLTLSPGDFSQLTILPVQNQGHSGGGGVSVGALGRLSVPTAHIVARHGYEIRRPQAGDPQQDIGGLDRSCSVITFRHGR